MNENNMKDLLQPVPNEEELDRMLDEDDID